MKTINNKTPRMSDIKAGIGTPFIHQYIRQRRTHMPIGVVLATTVPSVCGPVVRVGYSKCNLSEDSYDKVTCFNIAIERARENAPVPADLQSTAATMLKRGLRYFKNAKFEDVL